MRLHSADRINNRHIILNGAHFFEPDLDTSGLTDKEIVRLLVNKHIAPSPLCRAVYTESLLKNIAQTGISQYVILGAGMDTFAFREKEFVSGHRVYEVDHLRHNMENISGRLRFCHFWIDHDSMVQLTEDRNGRFHVAYVLDRNTSPEMRREAALLAQRELADCMQEWGVLLLNALVPERIKYASLAEAASHLMQVLNDPERIIG